MRNAKCKSSHTAKGWKRTDGQSAGLYARRVKRRAIPYISRATVPADPNTCFVKRRYGKQVVRRRQPHLFFDPIAIGDFREVFVDGAAGANNPVAEVWNEAKDVWPHEPFEDNIKCQVSIGTGVPSLTPFGKNVIETGWSLLAIATETERTAERFAREKARLGDEGRYF
jgi:hypothetical protein